MRRTTIGMGLVAIVLMAVAWFQGGLDPVWRGLLAGCEMLLVVLPMLVAAFLTAGLIQTLVSKDAIKRLLGHDAGTKAILMSALAGGLTPGGPYVAFPIAASFLVSGAGIGSVVAFVLAKDLWAFTRLPMELALLGHKITFTRMALCAFLPVLAGLFADRFCKGVVPAVRKEIEQLTKGQEES